MTEAPETSLVLALPELPPALEADGLAPAKLRHTAARCLICRELIECPPDAVVWAWVKTREVQEFLKAHEHGGASACGIEIAKTS